MKILVRICASTSLAFATALTAAAASQTIDFPAIPNQIFGGAPFQVTAKASSGLPVTFASSTPGVCKAATGLVVLKTFGTCSIVANQPGNSGYDAAPPVTETFTVKRAKPAESFISTGTVNVGTYTQSVVIADFNGDGFADIAVSDGTDKVSIMFGNGSGEFSPAPESPVTVSPNPVVLAVGDFNADGIPDLAVALNNMGVVILLGDGHGGFAPVAGSPFPTGSNPAAMVVGDFNSDGIEDLAIANFLSGNVTVLLGNGTGAFTAAPNSPITTGQYCNAIGVGDFNGDGIQDLVALSAGNQTISILLGNGSGGFTPAAGSPISLSALPLTLVIGDFNADGVLDLATGDGAGKVNEFLGDGLGGFSLKTADAVAILNPFGLQIGDFNGDGVEDLVVLSSERDYLTILNAKGTGGFVASSTSPFAAGMSVYSVAVGDVNNDGIPDLAVTDFTGELTILFGFASGGSTSQTITFAPPNYMNYGTAPFALSGSASSGLAVSFTSGNSSVCTVTGNTVSIVAAGACPIFASQPGNSVYMAAPTIAHVFNVNPASQTITFTMPPSISASVSPLALTAFASSGLPVSYASTTLLVCRISGIKVFFLAAGSCSITASQPGNANYFAATPVSQSFTVVQGSQSITFDTIPNQIFGISPFQIAAQSSSTLPVTTVSLTPATCRLSRGLVMLLKTGTCSLRADQGGNSAFTAATSVSRSFNVTSIRSSGAFLPAPGSPIAVADSPDGIAVGDFNGDGIPDLAVATNSDTSLSILLGNGSGGFKPATGSPIALGVIPGYVAAGDFNGDGNLDLALVMNYGVIVMTGDGTGQFTESPGSPYAITGRPGHVVVGDFNGDGIQDLAVANSGDGTVTILLGDGAAGFNPAPGSPIALYSGSPLGAPVFLAVGDFNNDGIQDLATANFFGGNITVLLGNASGGFALATGQPNSIGSFASSLTVGDFNGDGIQDLAVADPGDGTAVILIGTGHGTFAAAQGSPYAAGTFPYILVAGDFNGDSVQDLAAANQIGNNVSILLGNGSAGFTGPASSPFATGSAPVYLVAADFNGDGIEDLVISDSYSSLTVLLGQPAGTAAQTISFASLTNANFGVAPFAMSASASSGLAVTIASNTPAVCTVSSVTVTIVAAGGCSITASQPGNGTYAAAPPVTRSFTVYFTDVASTDYYYSAINALAQHGITAGCGNNNFCPQQNVTRDQMAIFLVRAIYGGDNFTYFSTPVFTDVQPSTFGFKWIQKLAELGITAGCGSGLYCPTSVVTRDQMAIFIERVRLGLTLAGSPPAFTYSTTPSFADAPISEFAFPWIQRLAQDNITSGCGATNYCPGSPVIRGDMAIFLMRGAFNQFLPAGTPVLTQISPSSIGQNGSGAYTITGTNTNFMQGTTQINPIPGMTIGQITVTSPNTLTVQLTWSSGATVRPYSVTAITGSEQAVLPNGLTLQ